jgi:hypothetical protein
MVNEPVKEAFISDEPLRPPVVYQQADVENASDTLTVRDLFWDAGRVIPRASWRFLIDGDSPPKVPLDSGFEPGLWYRVNYRATAPVVAGVGLAAIRDAASAFRYRSDLPVRGRSTFVYGNSQTGRFLREFLYDGFNADERDRRVFDAMWVHIAGAARGSYNERFATQSHGDMFEATQFPFADTDETDVDGTRSGLQSRYRLDQRPKVFYTNTPVEYWGGGRAAALTHTSADGKRDLTLPGNVRIYLLSSTQHLPFPFPPDRRRVPGPNGRNDGQELANPIPQSEIMRGLLRALYEWTVEGTEPPRSAYPRLRDKTLVPVRDIEFPGLPGVADPRRIVGPARRTAAGKIEPLPFLVPQVDRDGLDIAGIRDPAVAVPLATTTGWNFRDAARIGNAADIYQLLGSYIPFATTRSAREAAGDPRRSLEERYEGADDYLRRVRAAANDLIRKRFVLAEDLDDIMARAQEHWEFATRGNAGAPTAGPN